MGKLKSRYIELPAVIAADVPGTPDNGFIRLYIKEDGGDTRLFYKGDDGTEVQVHLQATAVTDLNQTISGTYVQAEVQAISDKVDELLAALRAADQLAA